MVRGVMELSTKALPKEAFEVAADFKSYLTSLGIVLGADQAAKTDPRWNLQRQAQGAGAGRLSDL